MADKPTAPKRHKRKLGPIVVTSDLKVPPVLLPIEREILLPAVTQILADVMAKEEERASIVRPPESDTDNVPAPGFDPVADETARAHPEDGNDTELPLVLSVDEVAALLRVNRKTVYELIARRELPGVQRLGRVIRVHRDVLLDWLRAGQGPTSRGTGRVVRRRS